MDTITQKFLVITACDAGYADLQEITAPTIQSYCDYHGYECQINRITETERPAAWYKIKQVLKGFETGADFVAWIDTDAIIVNRQYKLENIIEDDKHFYFACNWAAMNSGVFMMRNNEMNKKFLNTVWEQTQYLHDGWWEQRAIIHLLEVGGHYSKDNIKEIPSAEFNSEEYYGGCFVYHMAQMSKSERIKRVRKILKG